MAHDKEARLRQNCARRAKPVPPTQGIGTPIAAMDPSRFHPAPIHPTRAGTGR
jgi:hypothetical protein